MNEKAFEAPFRLSKGAPFTAARSPARLRELALPCLFAHDAQMALRDGSKSYLKRLSPEYYQGRAWIHWTMTIQDRAVGWLNEEMHLQVRELLTHTAARHHVACPAYCLMPDHAHFLWQGIAEYSDQLQAASFFRRHWNRLLSTRSNRLQRQAYEHVLIESERNPTAFEDTCLYILYNPERAGLLRDWKEWPYLGAVVAGYPDLNPRTMPEYWRTYWTIHHRVVGDVL